MTSSHTDPYQCSSSQNSGSSEGGRVIASRNHLRQFLQFGVVGASGVVVNIVVVILCKRFLGGQGIHNEDIVFNLFGSQFNVRWYHIITTVAFLVANVSNFQLNRMWTFRVHNKAPWLRQFIPFLVTGLGALVVSQIVNTLLINPTSPLSLPTSIFDDSTGFRTKLYWASIIAIAVSMPINFVVNKLWTFRKKHSMA